MRVQGVKSGEDSCTTKGHGSRPSVIDVEPRKRGFQSVLETPVVHALNDGRRTDHHGPRESRAPRLGNSRKAGDLMSLAGARTNGEACGLIRQYTGNLTSHNTGPARCLRVDEDGPCAGAAWLSSVRAVRRGVGSPNERNPSGAGGSTRSQFIATVGLPFSNQAWATAQLRW